MRLSAIGIDPMEEFKWDMIIYTDPFRIEYLIEGEIVSEGGNYPIDKWQVKAFSEFLRSPCDRWNLIEYVMYTLIYLFSHI